MGLIRVIFSLCLTLIASTLAGPVQAATGQFPSFRTEYTVVSTEGPTRENPVKYEFKDANGATATFDLWCHDELEVGQTQVDVVSVTVNTDTGIVDYTFQGESGRFAAKLAKLMGGTDYIALGSINTVEHEDINSRIRATYTTTAEVRFFTRLFPGLKLHDLKVKTVLTSVEGESVTCLDTYSAEGWPLPEPPGAIREESLSSYLMGLMKTGVLKLLIEAGLIDFKNKAGNGASASTGVRG